MQVIATASRDQRVFTKHETPRHGYFLARGASQREFRGFHETRITGFLVLKPFSLYFGRGTV